MDKQKVLFAFEDYKWDGIDTIDYKPDDQSAPTFSNVSRQNIFASKDGINFDVRYFECGENGFTSLEKHNHAHVVMALRGRGKAIIGDKVVKVKPNDLFVIPSEMPHQLVNTGKGPFGFVCTVNAERDKPRMLTEEEVEKLRKNDEICAVMRVPEGYFGN